MQGALLGPILISSAAVFFDLHTRLIAGLPTSLPSTASLPSTSRSRSMSVLCEIFNIMLQGALLVRTPASVVACGLSVREFMYRQCCMSVLGQVLQALGST